MSITSIPISGLNILTSITSSDFIPLVQSSSLTTYRVPVSDFLNLISSSGTVPTASLSFDAITASYALVYKPVYTFTRPLSRIAENSNEFCQIQCSFPAAYIVALQAGGDVVNEGRIYLVTDCNNSPNGFPDPSPSLDNYTGFYDMKSLAGSYYIDKVGSAADYALEISQSNLPEITVNTLRIRTVKNPAPGNRASASLTVFSIFNVDPSFSGFPNAGLAIAYPLNGVEIASSNSNPAWPTAFIDVRQYQMMVSGTIIVQNGISGSLFGTASWAQNNLVATSASWASSSFVSFSSTSASFASQSKSAISASWASQSFSSVSSSFASRSISASYTQQAATAAYVVGSGTGPGSFLRAFGTVLMGAANDYTTIMISSASYNIAAATYLGAGNYPWIGPISGQDSWGANQGLVNTLHALLPGYGYIVTFKNPMPTAYYTVVFNYIGYEPFRWESISNFYSPAGQTVNGFTMSFAGGDNSNLEAKYITSFTVLHP